MVSLIGESLEYSEIEYNVNDITRVNVEFIKAIFDFCNPGDSASLRNRVYYNKSSNEKHLKGSSIHLDSSLIKYLTDLQKYRLFNESGGNKFPDVFEFSEIDPDDIETKDSINKFMDVIFRLDDLGNNGRVTQEFSEFKSQSILLASYFSEHLNDHKKYQLAYELGRDGKRDGFLRLFRATCLEKEKILFHFILGAYQSEYDYLVYEKIKSLGESSEALLKAFDAGDTYQFYYLIILKLPLLVKFLSNDEKDHLAFKAGRQENEEFLDILLEFTGSIEIKDKILTFFILGVVEVQNYSLASTFLVKIDNLERRKKTQNRIASEELKSNV